MNTTRSAHEASFASWVTTTAAHLVLPQASWIERMTASALRESSAPDGSSASSRRRSPTVARAIATRWRSPPESSSGNFSALSMTPNASSAASASSLAARWDVPSSSSGSATFSAAVRPASRL